MVILLTTEKFAYQDRMCQTKKTEKLNLKFFLKKNCQGNFLEVMEASDKAVREGSSAWSTRWPAYRLAEAERLASPVSHRMM